MRQVFIVLLTLLPWPAFAECLTPLVGMGGSGLASAVSNADRRELESLLGTPLDHAVCGRMSRVWRLTTGFVAKRGFFVLTATEAVFVSDGKVKEVLFRADYADVHEQPRLIFPPGFEIDNTVDIGVTTDAGRFRVELACNAIVRAFLDELARRTPRRPRAPPLPPGTQRACD